MLTCKVKMEILFLIYILGILVLHAEGMSCDTQFLRADEDAVISFPVYNVSMLYLIDSPATFHEVGVTYQYFNGTCQASTIKSESDVYDCSIECEAGIISCTVNKKKMLSSYLTLYGTYTIMPETPKYHCLRVYKLGRPTRAQIGTEVSFAKQTLLLLTCSSHSTTTPKGNGLKLEYTWLVDGNEPTDIRYHSFFSDRHILAISDVQRQDIQRSFKCYARENTSKSLPSLRSDVFRLPTIFSLLADTDGPTTSRESANAVSVVPGFIVAGVVFGVLVLGILIYAAVVVTAFNIRMKKQSSKDKEDMEKLFQSIQVQPSKKEQQVQQQQQLEQQEATGHYDVIGTVESAPDNSDYVDIVHVGDTGDIIIND